ncbi:MAG: FAD-dependent oxidoreductase [Chromatiaceae bacterium]|nr:FAD-dependent oxidoreductase [Chromatiaceae bacterium]
MHRVTIVGSGFAALAALQELRRASPDLEITVVSPSPEFVYLPGLIWIPSGRRRAEDLRIPLGRFFARHGVRHLTARATGLRHGGRTLDTSEGPVNNDGLIIASGGRFLKHLPGIEQVITPCEGIAAAERIRERLATLEQGSIAVGFAGNPKEPTAMRGGPMFEFILGLDTQLREEGRRERFRLVFFSPAPQPGNRLGPRAVERLFAEMRRRGIETHIGHKLKGFSEREVLTEGGNVAADLILFMPGMTGDAWFDATELPRSLGGLLLADARGRLNAEGVERVYVAGDSGSYPGPDWMPKQAHMARLQGIAAARNLLAECAGEMPSTTFKPELLCIVDTNREGMLVLRTERLHLALPRSRFFHWLKRGFEWLHLQRYR